MVAMTFLVFTAAVAAACAIGYVPTRTQWGDAGVRSMMAVDVICLGAALVGAIPMLYVAPRWPSAIGQAALGGMTVRLMLTAAAGLGYQAIAKPHERAYLTWAAIV